MLLTAINAKMRRIDLFCKLVGPLFISIIDGFSTSIAILVNFGMNLTSVGLEYYTIAEVGSIALSNVLKLTYCPRCIDRRPNSRSPKAFRKRIAMIPMLDYSQVAEEAEFGLS